MKKRVELTKLTFAAIVVVVLALGFVAGTRSRDIYALMGPLVGVRISTDTLDLSSLQETYQTLKANYNGKINDQKLIDGANHGLVDALGDKYTVFMSAKEAKEFSNELTGNIGGGIGAEIGVRKGQPTIIRTLDDNPAQKAGVHAGDVIIAVNDESVEGKDAEAAVKLIRGEIGTTVKLTVRRGSAAKTFSITRDEITNPSVKSEIKDGIGILTLNRFDSETASLTQQAAQSFVNQRVKGVVLDLRGNGGGYLEAAQAVAGLWLRDKVVVTVKSIGSSHDLYSEGEPTLRGLKTVVLVNGGSASASEIVAGALKDYKVATLIGEKTYGKGTVQELFPLANDAELKVTIKRWYTPNGKNITDEGIAPNKKVGLTQKNLDADRDPQLEAALKQLGATR